ncbi:MAG TPA: tRNA pseudouridine(13) synthase TruD [Planctomycetaceae bacterium]|nr:tRNA pseudouridine(13) synthase TruD [Planctomycetaceae bacterium]
MHRSEPLPLVTADLPGIGGILKQAPEDFEVEELPAYEPCGEGEHLFLWVEKRDVSAERLVAHVARAAGIGRQDVGVAGLKDRRAVTRQYVSIPARCSDQVAAIETEGIRVLRTAWHRNKLRTGHLKGNRFRVLVSDVAADADERSASIALRLRSHGFANYFGEQRFGSDGDTASLGFDLLSGRKTPRDLPASRRRFLLRLALSAAQSALFNEALADRLDAGHWDRVEPGDVMQVVATGGLFIVEDAGREQPRFDAGETVPTGPMFGPKMMQPSGEPGAREQRLLEASGLAPDAFDRYARLTAGARRPLAVRPQELSIEREAAGLRLQFVLPPGAYATVLLREFCKVDEPA